MAHVTIAPELRFLLPARRRSLDVLAVPLDPSSSLGHVVESLGVPRTEVGELLVAGRAVERSFRPRAGDVVAVLPVRRPQRLARACFLADVHLGALARLMRLVGLDTAYRNDAGDPELVDQAVAEGRVLLTRDRGLLRRRALPAGAYVRGQRPQDQLDDVLDRFAPALSPWSRCPMCNGVLDTVPAPAVAHLLEPGTRRSYRDFSRCGQCGRVFWRGAHAARLVAIVESSSSGHRRAAHEPPAGQEAPGEEAPGEEARGQEAPGQEAPGQEGGL